jgi:hypothetical protein
MSKPVSRILSWTAIYLGLPLPAGSSHLLRTTGQAYMFSHGVAPDRVYSGLLLPISRAVSYLRLSTLTALSTAVYLCCTFPEVAFGGRYPLSCPVEPGLSSCTAFQLMPAAVWFTHACYCTILMSLCQILLRIYIFYNY